MSLWHQNVSSGAVDPVAAPAGNVTNSIYINTATNKVFYWDGAAWQLKLTGGGSGAVATDVIWDAKGDLAVGTGANTAIRLAVGTNGHVLTADSTTASGAKWAAAAGTGDALTSNPLSQFAATTSAQLAGVLTNETGTGQVVFSNSPILVTPTLGTPASGVLTNCTGTAAGLTAGTVTTNANLTGPVISAGNATTIVNDAVTYAMIQNVTDARLLGRSAGSNGDCQEITVGAGLSLAAGALTNTGGTYTDEEAQDAVGTILTDTASIDLTYTDATPSIKADITANGVSDVMLRDSAALSVIGRATNSIGDPADIATSADFQVLARSGASLAFQLVSTNNIASDQVTYAKIQNVSATDMILGRSTAGAGDIEEIPCTAAARTVLDDATVGAMVDTLGGASSTGTGGLVRATSPTFATSVVIPNAAGGPTIDANGKIGMDTTSKTLNFYDGAAERVLNPLKSKSVSILNPTSTENVALWYTEVAITIARLRIVLVGSASPSVTVNIKHSTTDRSAAGTSLITTPAATTSVTTGDNITSFDDATATAGWVWLVTTAKSGTVTELHATLEYYEDP